MKSGPLRDIKKFEKSIKKPKRVGESLIVPKNWKGGPFWVLYLKLEAFRCVQNRVLSTLGKSA